MKQENKILYWFRDELSIQRNNALTEALFHSTLFIPVYCFDPRESGLTRNDSENHYGQIVNAVVTLRHELRLKGSNLLVVHDRYEKIIPSLARVLGVNSVYTDPLVPEYKSAFQELERFRNVKTLEVKQLLNMHSIPVHLGPQQWTQVELPHIFPGFPDVNPGEIPSTPWKG
ncbi:MAG: Cryptochrome DASH [Bacteroidetes bacterium ADurb.Bin397]|jgi:deoxyribodipyrimidine photo-lyase|nr:MAG: Cryptochrome DASH [Bacteroidetes bacterium ADurb.Bin397]